MTVYNEWRLKYNYCPLQLSKEACYRYEILIKYKHLREKGFRESEALEFLNVKRSTYFSWLKRYNNKCGTIKMKTTELENKSRRPHNLRTTKIISPQLVSHILKIRQAEPMLGKVRSVHYNARNYKILFRAINCTLQNFIPTVRKSALPWREDCYFTIVRKSF